MRLVAATGNPGKLRELEALLSGLDIELLAQAALGVAAAPEDGLTFIENALLKARNAAAQTGLAALADDSGLEVDALGGAPGIHSARFAGAGASDGDNNALLLERLAGCATRTARFRCVVVVLRHAADPAPLVCSGTWEGRIGGAAAGDQGFGYDPLFIPAGESCTAAQLPAVRKNELSHRGRALAALRHELPRFLAAGRAS